MPHKSMTLKEAEQIYISPNGHSTEELKECLRVINTQPFTLNELQMSAIEDAHERLGVPLVDITKEAKLYNISDILFIHAPPEIKVAHKLEPPIKARKITVSGHNYLVRTLQIVQSLEIEGRDCTISITKVDAVISIKKTEYLSLGDNIGNTPTGMKPREEEHNAL